MEQLVIDWAKEEAKMARTVRNTHGLLLIILFLSQLYNNLFSQVNSASAVMMNLEKNSFYSL